MKAHEICVFARPCPSTPDGKMDHTHKACDDGHYNWFLMKARYFCFFTAAVFSLLVSISACASADTPLLSREPLCLRIENKAGYTIYGHVATDRYRNTVTGDLNSHRSNFRLENGAAQVKCATGPFFPGYQLIFALKTLVPVFECKIAVPNEIIVRSRKRADGSTELFANCG